MNDLPKDTPFFAIGNNELRQKKNIGKTVKCPSCEKKHKVRYGTNEVGFVECGDQDFLVSVEGKEL